MKTDYPKLIYEADLTSLILPNLNKEDLEKIFIDSILLKLKKTLSDKISQLEFNEPHFFNYRLQVYAQEASE